MLNAWWDLRTPICYCVFALFFLKQILTMQNTASTKNSQQFLASQVSVLRRNKTTYSSTSTMHFPAAMNTIVFGNNYSSLFDFLSQIKWRVKNKESGTNPNLRWLCSLLLFPRLMSSLMNGITCNIERTPWNSIFGNCDLRARLYCSKICSSFQLIKITFRLDFFFLYRPTFALGTSLEESLIWMIKLLPHYTPFKQNKKTFTVSPSFQQARTKHVLHNF